MSGGPDSLALLLLAAASLPGRCAVATVDHRLRVEAAAETAFVAERCAALGVPCDILSIDVPAGNLHDAARQARYAALGAWAARRGLAGIATAHHADDQAETVVMRLNRGSGLAGLAGIRAARPLAEGGGGGGTRVVRPLLGWRKAELAGVVGAAGWTAVRDPSNHDPRFERARVRAGLAGVAVLDAAGIAASAGHLAAAAEALAWAGRRAWLRARREGEGWCWPAEGEPAPILAAVIAQGIAAAGGARVDAGEATRLAERIGAGGKGNLGGVLVSRAGATWRFVPEPPRRGG